MNKDFKKVSKEAKRISWEVNGTAKTKILRRALLINVRNSKEVSVAREEWARRRDVGNGVKEEKGDGIS